MNLMAFQVHPFLLFSVFSLLSLLALLHPHHIQPLNFPNWLVQLPEVNGGVGVFGTSQLDVC